MSVLRWSLLLSMLVVVAGAGAERYSLALPLARAAIASHLKSRAQSSPEVLRAPLAQATARVTQRSALGTRKVPNRFCLIGAKFPVLPQTRRACREFCLFKKRAWLG